MAKNITLNEVAERSIRDIARRRIDEIDQELERINVLKDEKRSLQAAIEQLDGSESSTIIDPHYQPTWTWNQKATYIIKKANEPITTREIVNEIVAREPGMDRKKAVSGVSSVLSTSKEFTTGKNERNEKTFTVSVDDGPDEDEDWDEVEVKNTPMRATASAEPSDDLPFWFKFKIKKPRR